MFQKSKIRFPRVFLNNEVWLLKNKETFVAQKQLLKICGEKLQKPGMEFMNTRIQFNLMMWFATVSKNQ